MYKLQTFLLEKIKKHDSIPQDDLDMLTKHEDIKLWIKYLKLINDEGDEIFCIMEWNDKQKLIKENLYLYKGSFLKNPERFKQKVLKIKDLSTDLDIEA